MACVCVTQRLSLHTHVVGMATALLSFTNLAFVLIYAALPTPRIQTLTCAHINIPQWKTLQALLSSSCRVVKLWCVMQKLVQMMQCTVLQYVPCCVLMLNLSVSHNHFGSLQIIVLV